MVDTSAIPPLPSTVGAPSQLPPSIMNRFRISAVAERLTMYLKDEPDSSSSHFNNPNYIDLLLSLARGIDYSISQNEIPFAVKKLPELLNEIRRRKMDDYSKAYVMVLMISVQGACKAGWFSEKESQDLMSFADEIGSCFGKLRDINVGPSDALSAVSTIFSRFYPQMKMGHILGSLEVPPGYGAFIGNFQFLKSKSPSAEENIMLFTARLDNVETSACIATPQKVNILLNGCGVERRTNVLLDPRPQLPTYVTQMVNYGANILQAVGQFCGHYMIVIALISISSQPESILLKDYAPSSAFTSYPDSDISVGQSRISLNCPIRHTRIQVPVKGQSCRHLQCFDYSNYVSMNSSHPLWHCPKCGSPVCFTDLCIDQNIAKILKEVSADVCDVLISGDGSWNAVMETNNEIAPQRLGSDVVCDLIGDADETDTNINEVTKPVQYVYNQTNVVNSTPLSGDSNLNVSFAAQSNPRNASSVAGHNRPGSFQTPPCFMQKLFRMNSPIPYGGSSTSSSPPWVPPRVSTSQGSTMPPSPFSYNMTMQGGSFFSQPLQQATEYPIQCQNAVQTSGLVSQFQISDVQMALNQLGPGAAPPRTQSPLSTPQIKLLRPHALIHPQPIPRAFQQTPRGECLVPPGGFMAVTRNDERVNTRSEPISIAGDDSLENWQPIGRMRGSITNSSYGNDVSRLMIQPNGVTRPSGLAPPNRVSNLSTPPHLR